MNWLELSVAVLATAGVLLLPGLVLSLVIGLRGLWSMAIAPVFSMTVIGLSSLSAPYVGLSWSAVPVIAMTAALAALLLALRLALRRWWTTPSYAYRGHVSFLFTGIGIAAFVIAVCSIQVMGEPGSFSQTFDNIFHLNAVRYILDTGNASPLHLGSLTSETLWFYPASWHALSALVVNITGASIPIAVNAVWLTFSAAVWPLSVILLTRELFGSRAGLMITAGLVAASLPAFPILMIDYGVLYPYHAGLAMVPVAIATLVRLFACSAAGRNGSILVWAVALAGVLPGLALVHPGSFVTVLALSLPVVIFSFTNAVRSRPSRSTVLALSAGLLAYIAVGFGILRVLRPPAEASGWPPTGTAAQAIGEVAAVGLFGAETALVAAVLLITGVCVAIKQRRKSAMASLGMFLVAAILYVVAAGVDFAPIRSLLTGSWYNNAPRLAAIVPALIVPLAALGGQWIWDRLIRPPFTRHNAGVRRRSVAFAATGLVIAGSVALQTGPMGTAVQAAHSTYALTPSSPLINSDERALLERVPSVVPPGVTIAGSPWTGAGLAYALADRPVLMPHTLMDVSHEVALINERLDSARQGSRVCEAVQQEHVGFVLDFGTQEVHGGDHDYRGLDELALSEAVRLVDQEGRARLYEITACSNQTK